MICHGDTPPLGRQGVQIPGHEVIFRARDDLGKKPQKTFTGDMDAPIERSVSLNGDACPTT